MSCEYCKSKKLKTLRTDHLVCLDCKAHFYLGKWVNKKLWEAWVNGETDIVFPEKDDIFLNGSLCVKTEDGYICLVCLMEMLENEASFNNAAMPTEIPKAEYYENCDYCED